MDITIHPQPLKGDVTVIPSKSQAHRLLICAAFADRTTELICPETNSDIEATADCLRSLGADIVRSEAGYTVTPLRAYPGEAALPCRESGSTLRFLLPIVGAMGVTSVFKMEGRLPKRPLSPLWEEMARMGCSLNWLNDSELQVTGKLRPGDYYIDGSVSSQFISGLLLAAPLLDGDTTIHIQGKLESAPYVEMTRKAMALSGVDTTDFHVKGDQAYHSPGTLTVEGDWSNAAFFLAANKLGNSVEIKNLNYSSAQGDRSILNILTNDAENPIISARDISDLVPILAATFGAKNGAVFEDISRLRLKESDRVASVCNMLNQLGADSSATKNTLTVYAGQYHSCIIDTANDHRIAMAAAIAATVADGPVTILGAECVAKSYPTFWDDYKILGGHYEQYIR